jgi:NAD(P)-dependent dehydrogenase (short-subunit alcohol dehydrogenase family)
MNKKTILITKNDTQNVNLSGKNIIITGATAGIGKETARNLAKMGGNIIFATRNRDKTLNTIAEIREDIKNDKVILEHKFLDLIDSDSVRNFPSLLGKIDTVDVLINNAGVTHDTGITKQGIEKIFGINYLSHFFLTKQLMPILIKSRARIINVSSMGHSSAKRKHFDMPYKGECSQLSPQQLYGRSKGAQILFTKALQRRFDEKNISCTCNSLHPGGVRTNIFDTYNLAWKALICMLWPILIDTTEGAKTSVYLASTDRPEETGGKYFYYGFFLKGIYEKKGKAYLHDEELQEWLWIKSEELIGEEFRVG